MTLRLKWNDWILYVIRTLSCISVIYFAVKFSDNSSLPMWVLAVFVIVSYVVPLVLLQFGIKAYLISELAMLAVLVPYLASVDHLLAGNLILYSLMVGFYNERKMYLWSGICMAVIAIGGPALLLPQAPVSYSSILLSCVMYTALGFVFHYLISAKREIENKNAIIHEQYQLMEQYAKQVEQQTVLKERNRISEELQGSIHHTFTTFVLSLELLKREISSKREDAMVSHLMDITRTGLAEVKQAVEALEPLELKHSLNELISSAAEELKNTGIEVVLRLKEDERDVTKEHMLLLIRCLHESISLARRDGGAAHIRITVDYSNTAVKLIVEDDGQGSEEERLMGGIESLKRQLKALDGSVHVQSFFNQGITSTYTLPLIMVDKKVSPIKIVVSDSEPVVREALTTLLSMQADIEAITDQSAGASMLDICSRAEPDIILLATNHEGLDYISLIAQIKERSPDIKIILLTSSDNDRQLAMEAIHLGAEGFIEKAISSKELLSKIRLVYHGEMIITQQLAKQLVQTNIRQRTNEYGLTERELEVLQCLSEKMKYKEIAEKLFLAEGTVRNYLSVIYSKLEVTSRTQATEKAQLEGII